MALPAIVEPILSGHQTPQSGHPLGHQERLQQALDQRPNRSASRTLLALPLAGMVTVLLIGCVGRPDASKHKRLDQGDSSALHHLNRGRVGPHEGNEDLND
jgi:hypothetical protein